MGHCRDNWIPDITPLETADLIDRERTSATIKKRKGERGQSCRIPRLGEIMQYFSLFNINSRDDVEMH